MHAAVTPPKSLLASGRSTSDAPSQKVSPNLWSRYPGPALCPASPLRHPTEAAASAAPCRSPVATATSEAAPLGRHFREASARWRLVFWEPERRPSRGLGSPYDGTTTDGTPETISLQVSQIVGCEPLTKQKRRRLQRAVFLYDLMGLGCRVAGLQGSASKREQKNLKPVSAVTRPLGGSS